MKYAPRRTVISNLMTALLLSLEIKLWWAKVTVPPDIRRTPVFNRGTEKGFRVFIAVGGQLQPSSGVGPNLL